MAKKEIYFFTDPDLLDAPESASTYKQIETDSFGSVNTTGTTFLCCSVHKSNNGVAPPAYAITSGRVAVYEHDDGIHATLVLQPTIQPSELKMNDLPRVKFYIYRGVLLSSVINGISVAAENAGNDMIDYIWDKYQEAGTPPKESILVYKNSTDPLLTPISASFENKPSGEAPYFELDAGKCIGKFSASGFSVEIILDDYDYDPTLSILAPESPENPGDPLDYIRHHIIAAPLVNNNNDRFSSFLQRHKREEVLHYLDPAAFYGSLYFTNVRYRIGTSDDKDKEAGFYNAVTSKFFNRNVLYLDVRNNHSKSFNYYNFLESTSPAYIADYGYYPRYEDDVKIGIEQDPSNLYFLTDSYYSNGWPLRKIVPPPILQANTTNQNLYKLSLSHDRLPTGRHDYKQMIYLANGFINDGTKFSKHTPKANERFIDLSKDGASSPGSFYFGPFKIPVPNIPVGTQAKPVCWYTRLYYLRQTQEKFTDAVKKDLIPDPQYFMDYAFDPIAMNKKAEVSAYKNFRTTTYVDFEPEGNNQKDFTGSIGIAKDALYTSLFIIPGDSRFSVLKDASTGISDTGGRIPAGKNFLKHLDDSVLNGSIKYGTLTLNTIPPTVKHYHELFKRYGFKAYDELGLTILVMQNANWSTVLEFIQEKFDNGEMHPDLGVTLVMKDRNDTNDNANDDLANAGTDSYLSFQLYIKGFKSLTTPVIPADMNAVDIVEFDLGLTFYGKKEKSSGKLSTIFMEDNITNSLIQESPEELLCPDLKLKETDTARAHDYTSYIINPKLYSDTQIDTALETITELSATVFKEDLVDFITTMVNDIYYPPSDPTDYKIKFGQRHNLFLIYQHVWSKMIITDPVAKTIDLPPSGKDTDDVPGGTIKAIYGSVDDLSDILITYTDFHPAILDSSNKVQLKFDSITKEISGGADVENQGFFLEAAYTFAMWKLGRTMRHVYHYLNGLRESDLSTKLTYYFEQLAISSPFYKRLEQALEQNNVQPPHKLFDDKTATNNVIRKIIDAYALIFKDDEEYDTGLSRIFFPMTNTNPGYIPRIKPFNDFTIPDEDGFKKKLIRAISDVKKDYLKKVIYCIYQRLGGTGKYSSFYNFAIRPTGNPTGHIFTDKAGIFFMDVFLGGSGVSDDVIKVIPFELQRSSDKGTVAIVHFGLYGADQTTLIKPELTGYTSKAGTVVAAPFSFGDEFYRISRGYSGGSSTPRVYDKPDNVWRQAISGGYKILGSFNPETGDLTITNDDVSVLNFKFSSDSEVHFNTICVSEIPATGMFSFAKAFPDLFTDDVFQLSEAQLSQIWNFSTEEADNIDALIKILFDNDAVLKVNMTGGFIGKQILPTLYVTGNSYKTNDMVTFISDTDGLHVYKAITTTSIIPGNSPWVKQEYSASTTYQKGDFVSDGVFVYRCLENNTTTNTVDQTKWKIVAQKYDTGTNFCYNDKVIYKNKDGVHGYFKCTGDDISGDFNKNSWLITSMIESDERYAFDPDNNLSPAELLEVQIPPGAGTLTADQFARVRYAYADIQWSLNDNAVIIHIEAYASPLISRLDHVMTNNSKSVSLVNAHTLYGQDATVNAFIDRIGEPDIPSYNQLLTALRCWGVLKGITDQIESRTNSEFPTMSTKIHAKLTEMLNEAFVKTTLSNGYPNILDKQINQTNYNLIKL